MIACALGCSLRAMASPPLLFLPQFPQNLPQHAEHDRRIARAHIETAHQTPHFRFRGRRCHGIDVAALFERIQQQARDLLGVGRLCRLGGAGRRGQRVERAA